MPGGLGCRCADAGQQVLLPQEPLAVRAALTQLDGTGVIGTAAGDKQLHIPLLLTGHMVALNGNRVRLGGCVVVVRCGAGEIGKRQVGLAVAEAVVQERNFLSVQRARSAQPIQHLRSDALICRIRTQSENRKCRRFEGCVEACLGKRLHFGKALRQRSEGKCFPLTAQGLCGGIYRLPGCAFQLIKDTHG